MRCRSGEVDVHYIEHGAGSPVLVLHGAGVDHREAEACFEPALNATADGSVRRIYPDLPGMGDTPAPASLRSAQHVLDVLIGFAEQVGGGRAVSVVGHSAGGYYGYGLAASRPDLVAGLALVCPLLPGVRDVPDHRPVIADEDLGDAEFRGYFVLQTPVMWQRHQRFVAPAAELFDLAAAERIGAHWELPLEQPVTFDGPTVIIAGRQDSIVGYAAAMDLVETFPHATLAVVDGAGHALPHERPDVVTALIRHWLARAHTR